MARMGRVPLWSRKWNMKYNFESSVVKPTKSFGIASTDQWPHRHDRRLEQRKKKATDALKGIESSTLPNECSGIGGRNWNPKVSSSRKRLQGWTKPVYHPPSLFRTSLPEPHPLLSSPTSFLFFFTPFSSPNPTKCPSTCPPTTLIQSPKS